MHGIWRYNDTGFWSFAGETPIRVRKTHLVRAPCAFRHRSAASTPSLAALHLTNYLRLRRLALDQDVARDLAHVVGAGQCEAHGEFLADDVECQRHARLAARRERVEKRLADETALGAQCQS